MMKPPKTDRRSRRTRQLIGSALVDLMLEKRYEDITVQDILDRADIGRSTFYAHYTDKEDLLLSEIQRVVHQLDEYATEAGGGHGLLPTLELFQHVQEQRRLLQAFMWGKSAIIHTQDFQRRVSQIIERNLRAMLPDAPESVVPLPVVASFIASTFLMLLRWWFDEDLRHTPEQMEAMFRTLVMPAVHSLSQ